MSKENRSGFMPTPAEWLEWRRHNTIFTDIALTQPADATLSGDSEPEQVPARKATWNLWGVLGVKPLIGRVFTEEEDEKGVRLAVISYGLWQRRYGGSPDVVGRKINVNDNSYEVIGVMSREFYFMPARDIDIWMPASFPAWMRRNFSARGRPRKTRSAILHRKSRARRTRHCGRTRIGSTCDAISRNACAGDYGRSAAGN
jgi:hypothetical protein